MTMFFLFYFSNFDRASTIPLSSRDRPTTLFPVPKAPRSGYRLWAGSARFSDYVSFAKTSDGFPSRIILPDSHDDAAVGIHRLVHIMGYHDHRHALLLIEPFCNGDYLSPASQVKKHGRCLVKHKDISGSWQVFPQWLFSAFVRLKALLWHDVGIRAYPPLSGIFPRGDYFLAFNPQIFGAEGHVLFNYCGNYLIVRILKNKTHRPPDVEHIPLVGRKARQP